MGAVVSMGGLSLGAKIQEGKERCRQAAKKGMIKYWKKKKGLSSNIE
jgi:hypothetical protein